MYASIGASWVQLVKNYTLELLMNRSKTRQLSRFRGFRFIVELTERSLSGCNYEQGENYGKSGKLEESYCSSLLTLGPVEKN